MHRHEKFWDKASETYDKTEERFGNTHVKVVENTLKHLKPDQVVLDHGCGTGSKALKLAPAVNKLHAIDVSSKMIEAARGKAEAHGLTNVEFTHALISDERLEPGSFDVVCSFNILHALEDGPGTVRRAWELLKPGGLYISTTPCLGEKMAFWIGLQFSFFLSLSRLGLIPHVTRFRVPQLDALIAGGGFQVVETETLHDVMLNHYVVARKP
jgi:2-polyprenyl-3-methyl-5-hydroxy-6-metoxy-1,4-benzoquinol methylase